MAGRAAVVGRRGRRRCKGRHHLAPDPPTPPKPLIPLISRLVGFLGRRGRGGRVPGRGAAARARAPPAAHAGRIARWVTDGLGCGGGGCVEGFGWGGLVARRFGAAEGGGRRQDQHGWGGGLWNGWEGEGLAVPPGLNPTHHPPTPLSRAPVPFTQVSVGRPPPCLRPAAAAPQFCTAGNGGAQTVSLPLRPARARGAQPEQRRPGAGGGTAFHVLRE